MTRLAPRWQSLRRTALGWALSLGCHGGTLYWLGEFTPMEGARHAPSSVEFSVMAPPKAPEPQLAQAPAVEPEVAVARAPAAEPEVAVARAPAAAPRAAPAKPTQPDAPPAVNPVDMTGVTLTAGDGWSTVVGNGAPMLEPLRVPAPEKASEAASAPRAVARTAPTSRGAPLAVVALAELRDKPRPPPLDQALLRNYPEEARRTGTKGRAEVVARIEPDGSVREVQRVSESAPGFGAACAGALRGSVWSVPRDRLGQAVPTRIRYTCYFRVSG